MNADLGRREGAADDLGGLYRGETLKVVEEDRRAVVSRQAVDLLAGASPPLLASGSEAENPSPASRVSVFRADGRIDRQGEHLLPARLQFPDSDP